LYLPADPRGYQTRGGRYQNVVVGDLSSLKLAKTRMARSVLDSGWGMAAA
jgi:hypothetical protein